MITNTSKAVLVCAILLGLVYIFLFPQASNGYGYVGYNGYQRGASFWYFDGPTIYTERSNRSGSVHGTKRIGGGPESGK